MGATVAGGAVRAGGLFGGIQEKTFLFTKNKIGRKKNTIGKNKNKYGKNKNKKAREEKGRE